MTRSDLTSHSALLGATVRQGGTNFSVFSRAATGIELLLFDYENDSKPSRIIPIDPHLGRSYHYWHVFVQGIKAGQLTPV